jgi:phosphoribosylformylglycinamidine cyclo-ligase
MSKKPEGLRYQDCGVNIKKGSQLVNYIKKQTPKIPALFKALSNFGAGFQLDLKEYKNPVLVTSTDGVGTKLKVAFQHNKHNTIGIDLVAMVVNDIICHGAKPLFFLDYFATGKIDLNISKQVMDGIIKGCELAGCALIGGETAEMPGFYQNNEYDLAGFGVGIIDKSHYIDGSAVKIGDSIIGIHSSGLHSNGYSMARDVIFTRMTMDVNTVIQMGDEPESHTIGDILLTPTKIYVNSIMNTYDLYDIHGIANITGGGITENVARILPRGCAARININFWDIPDFFYIIQAHGGISDIEMRKTFNLGIGMVLIVPSNNAQPIMNYLINKCGEQCSLIGEVVRSNKNGKVIFEEI